MDGNKYFTTFLFYHLITLYGCVVGKKEGERNGCFNYAMISLTVCVSIKILNLMGKTFESNSSIMIYLHFHYD